MTEPHQLQNRPFRADGVRILDAAGNLLATAESPELAEFFASAGDMLDALDTAALTLEHIEQIIEPFAPDSPVLQKIKAAIVKAGG